MTSVSFASLRQALEQAKVGDVAVAAGDLLLRQGEYARYAYALADGWAFRASALSDGRRQITRILMPFELIGFHAEPASRANSSVEAITDSRFFAYSRQELLNLLSSSSSLITVVLELFAQQECEWETFALTVGRRTAEERIAWMILHLLERSRRVSRASENKMVFPITQALLADALGLSIVHTNKTLSLLKRDQLINWTSRSLEVLDYDRLAELALYESPDETC